MRMGTGPSGLQNTIEDDDMLDVDSHGVGELKHIPIEIKPRGRLGQFGLRSVGSLGKKQPKGGSLQSALSFDLENPEVERIRRDFEMFRKNKDNELANLQKKEQKLEAESKRLRAELKALQHTCHRLRAEKEEAVQAERQAMARASAFESERDKVQRQFKIFRETKECEIQNLLRAKRSLENKLSKVAPDLLPDDAQHQQDDDLGPGSSPRGTGTAPRAGNSWWTPQLDNEHGVHPLNRMQPGAQWRKSDTSSVILRAAVVPGGSRTGGTVAVDSQLSSSRRIVFRIYISYSTDMDDELRTFVKTYIPRLRNLVESRGRYLTAIHLPAELLEEKGFTEEQDLVLRETLIDQCHSLIMFFGAATGRFLVHEIKLCSHFEAGADGKHVIICPKGPESSLAECSEMKELRAAKHDSFIEEYSSMRDKLEAVHEKIRGLISLDLSKDSKLDGNDEASNDEADNDESDIFDEHGHVEHMEALQGFANSTSDCGFDKYYERLNGLLSTPGPLPPLLVIGPPGSGKSHLLAHWVMHHHRQSGASGTGLLLYHSVSGRGSTSADAVHMLRRFTSVLMENVVGPPTLTCDPVRLVEEFPSWLDKVSSQLPDGVTLVIDGLDKCQDGEQYLLWLLDPLPVDARVVVAVDEETCAPAWRSWPALNVETLFNKDVRDILRAEISASGGSALSAEQESRVLTHCRTAHTCCPLYVVVLAAHVASCRDEKKLSQRLDNLLATSDALELYLMVIDYIRQDTETVASKGMLKQVLKLLCACRNGIGEWELMELLPDLGWHSWAIMSRSLEAHHIVRYRAGLVCIAHDQARRAIHDKYFREKTVVGAAGAWSETRKLLASYWASKLARSCLRVTGHIADELPWCLQQLSISSSGAASSLGTDEKQQLKDCIMSVGMFLSFYARGRCHELIGYWLHVGVDKVQMAELYLSATKKLESMASMNTIYEDEADDSVEATAMSLPEIADVYEAQSRFLRDLGLLNEAAGALQRSLELRETSLDPDDPRVARSLHRLGSLYARWSKHASAEAKYKQALDAYEGGAGRRGDRVQIASILSSLAALYEKQGRRDAAEPLLRRAIALRSTGVAVKAAPGSMALAGEKSGAPQNVPSNTGASHSHRVHISAEAAASPSTGIADGVGSSNCSSAEGQDSVGNGAS